MVALSFIFYCSFNIRRDWRCMMCSEDLCDNRLKVLSEKQNYKIDTVLFVVKPVFKEDGANTITKALLNLMSDDVSKF